jgi:GNAT superfamily N-acetyltransferase
VAEWEITQLDGSHERNQFDCGRPELNQWLQQRARNWGKKGLARTYVAVSKGESSIRGYYAISSHQVQFEALPADQAKGLPRIDVPVVLLGKLAVDKTTQGQGLGALLLIDALRRVDGISEQIGIRAVEVDTIDDQARAFCLKYGFVALQDDQNHLFLPMTAIRKLNFPPHSSSPT